MAGGAIAIKILNEIGISLLTYSRAIGPVTIPQNANDLLAALTQSNKFGSLHEIRQQILANPLYMPDNDSSKQAQEYLDECMKHTDSAGGIVEGIITGVPTGVGEPVFDKLDANLAKAIFSIGAVKGFEIGDGFAAAASKGTENNDNFCMDNGQVTTATNHAGGILGGISSGAPIIFRAAFKPTPSVASTQQTVNKSGEEISISIHGRHDPIIVPRAVVVVECMAALTLVDLMLENMGAKIEDLKKRYPCL